MMDIINNSIPFNYEVFYFDIKHQLHNVKNGYAYQKKGKANTKCIRSNLTLLRFYNLISLISL